MHNTAKFDVRIAYTNHARTRMQQRSIAAEAVDLLLSFARPTPVGAGALSYRFDNESWAEACEVLGSRAKHFEKYRNAYVIEDGRGVVITAAWLQ